MCVACCLERQKLNFAIWFHVKDNFVPDEKSTLIWLDAPFHCTVYSNIFPWIVTTEDIFENLCIKHLLQLFKFRPIQVGKWFIPQKKTCWIAIHLSKIWPSYTIYWYRLKNVLVNNINCHLWTHTAINLLITVYYILFWDGFHLMKLQNILLSSILPDLE